MQFNINPEISIQTYVAKQDLIFVVHTRLNFTLVLERDDTYNIMNPVVIAKKAFKTLKSVFGEQFWAQTLQCVFSRSPDFLSEV